MLPTTRADQAALAAYIVLAFLAMLAVHWLTPPVHSTTACPGVDADGYVLTEVYPNGSFRCERP